MDDSTRVSLILGWWMQPPDELETAEDITDGTDQEQRSYRTTLS